MEKILSMAVYIIGFLPIWAFRKVTGTSKFERSFRARASTWDNQSVGTGGKPKKTIVGTEAHSAQPARD